MAPLAKALARQSHFWLATLSFALGQAVMVATLTKHDQAVLILGAIANTIGYAAYLKGVRWRPPSKQWTQKERLARGLPPVPPPPPKE